jgi:hypothetical protein
VEQNAGGSSLGKSKSNIQLDPTSSSVRRKFGPARMIFRPSIHFHYHDADADGDAEDGQGITT